MGGGSMTKVTVHRFAERAPERQHRAADQADAGVGDHHAPDDFPSGATDAIGRSIQDRRHRFETSRETEAMNGNTMMARTKPAVSIPIP